MIELFASYPEVPEDALGPMNEFTYHACDGLELRGYLTLPPDGRERGLPLVVLPHGGPTVRDYLRYDAWAQFLATRGYAVAQPNFRGSSGYGWEFARAGFGQWGRKMQDDATDVARHLIAEGTADSARVAIVGSSYGGYVALMGLIREPDLFRCGASLAGVTSLKTLLDEKGWFLGADSVNAATIGKAAADANRLMATSPAFQAAKLKAPVLIAHAKDDPVVTFQHAEMMIDALEKAGNPAETFLMKFGRHSLAVESSRIRFFEKLEDFLGRCLAEPLAGAAVPAL
jgi:dipeptidyl aminopeptidase/acylaminoacyl peptidase